MSTPKQRHIQALRDRYAASLSDSTPGMVAMMRDFQRAFTRIGNALGLEGTFMIHFGYEQIEQRAKDAMIRMDSLERMEP